MKSTKIILTSLLFAAVIHVYSNSLWKISIDGKEKVQITKNKKFR